MATLSFTIPDEIMPRVVDALSIHYGYVDTIPDGPDGGLIPNPQTKGQFVKQQLAQYLKRIVKDVEGGTAASIARETAENEVDIS